MASEVVGALAQDSEGILWAGTEAGLHFFRGDTFVIFPEQLPSQIISGLCADPDGSLWVATGGGLAKIHHWKVLPASATQGFPREPVQSLGRDAEGHLWVLGTSGLRVQDGEHGFIPAPPLPTVDKATLLQLFAHPAVSGAWVIAGRTLWHWEEKGNRWANVKAPPVATSESFLGISVDGMGQLWLRTSRGLWRQQEKGPWLLSRSGMEGGFGAHTRLERDLQGWVWSEQADGLWRYRGDRQEPIAPRSLDAQGALVDRDGGIWLRGQRGVTRLLGQFRWRAYGAREGLAANTIWQSVRDPQGRLWVATDGGLCLGDGGPWKRIIAARITGAVLGQDQTLWAIGSPSGTIHEVDLRTLTVRSHRVDPLPIGRLVAGIAQDVTGAIWVGDPQEGLARGIRRQGRWTWERIRIDGEEVRLIKNILAGPDGRIFVIHGGGIAVWQGGRWSRVEGLADTNPTNLAFSPGGDLVVGYQNRPILTRHRLGNGRYQRFEELDLFRSRPQISIFALAFEPNGNLWMGTSQGVARILPGQAGSFRFFSPSDGLVSPDCDEGSIFAERGRVWIGTSQGLAMYRTDLLEDPLALPPPLILSARAGGGAIPLSQDNLTIPRGTRDLDITFLVPSYQLPGRLTYESRLAGIDPGWVNLEQARVRYPSLRSGLYRLELRGALDSGLKGPVRTLTFEVLPRWWESSVAWICYVLLAGAGIYGVFQLRQAQLRRRNEELQDEVALQTQAFVLASQAKSAFLANMSHELRTPLTAILLYSELVQEDAKAHGLKKLEHDASRIQGAGRHLLALIDDILDVSKIEAGHMRIALEDLELGTFLTDLAATLRPAVEKKGNRFIVDLAQAPPSFRTDSLRLLQVLTNLLSNAGKFTEHGEVTLRVQTAGTDVHFIVQDTGIGMSEASLEQVFQEFVQADADTSRKYGGTGLGLTLVKRLTTLLGGRVQVESRLGVGTTFTICLPLQGGNPGAAAPASGRG
jgi:signal transduction histidine kinase/ligand-binding sensor domain-containing protein